MTTFNSLIAQYAEMSRRLVNQAGAIVLQANDQISKGTFDTARWAKSAYELSDLALTSGMQAAPQVMSIASLWRSSKETLLSDYVRVAPYNESRRTFTVVEPFVHVGAHSCVIPVQSIVFVPETLPAYAVRFRVGARWADLRSGTYRGRVRLTSIASAEAHSHEMPVIIDL